MKRLVLAAAMALTLVPAMADWVFVDGDLSVIPREQGACYPKVMEFIKTLKIPAELEWKKADVTFEGKPLQACWAFYEGAILVVDEDQAGGAIPQSEFKELKGT